MLCTITHVFTGDLIVKVDVTSQTVHSLPECEHLLTCVSSAVLQSRFVLIDEHAYLTIVVNMVAELSF